MRHSPLRLFPIRRRCQQPRIKAESAVTLWRVLPSILADERRDIEVAPDTAHGLVDAVVDEVYAEHLSPTVTLQAGGVALEFSLSSSRLAEMYPGYGSGAQPYVV